MSEDDDPGPDLPPQTRAVDATFVVGAIATTFVLRAVVDATFVGPEMPEFPNNAQPRQSGVFLGP